MTREDRKEKVRNIGGGGFFLSLLLNLILSIGWAVPGVLLIVAHFIYKPLPLWVGLGALGLWFAVEFIQTLLLVLVISVANKPSVNDEHLKENKNPYSKKGEYERNLQKKCDNDI